MTRPPDAKITASDALLKAMKRWANVVTTQRDDHDERSINSTCLIIGRKISDRLQTGLMTSKFSPAWLEPILQFVERSAKQLYESGGNADDLTGNLIAEIAALRLESLEFEVRIRDLNRR
ncbi:MAG: hypothetical protein Q7R90_04865 [bacterium]|nr:hypothetical protein [bacterium]